MNVYHISFYYSNKKGSEYRAAFEQHNFLKKIYNSQVKLVCSNLEENDILPSAYVVNSPVIKQKTLYKYTDLIPSIIWHFKVVYYFKTKIFQKNSILYLSGVMPWHPIYLYSLISNKIILFGVGGGKSELNNLQESIRNVLSNFNLKIISWIESKIQYIIPRTLEAKKLWTQFLKEKVTEVVPEIINPISKKIIPLKNSDKLTFVWIGQDINRKNLDLGLIWFKKLQNKFPHCTLDVFGAKRGNEILNVNYHGWVNIIKYEDLSSKLVLLLSSHREGLPSAAIEIIQRGGIVISRQIGSLSSLKCENIIFTDNTLTNLNYIETKIKKHFDRKSINVSEINFENTLKNIDDEMHMQ